MSTLKRAKNGRWYRRMPDGSVRFVSDAEAEKGKPKAKPKGKAKPKPTREKISGEVRETTRGGRTALEFIYWRRRAT